MKNPSPGARDPATEPLVDVKVVAALADHLGRQRLAPLLAEFCAEMTRRGGLLEAALAATDWPAIDALTHSIKGSALTFGAQALGASASAANAALRADDLALAQASTRRLLQLIAPTCAAMLATCAAGGASP